MAIITISGNIGAGKSTIAPILAKKLGYEELYVGGLFREMAKKKGLTIEEFYAHLDENPELEKSVDSKQVKLMRQKDNVIVQGRIAYFFATQTHKSTTSIFLAVNPRIGAKRKIDEGLYPGKTIEEVISLNLAREEDEREHYRSLYGIADHLNPEQFDIVCDTTNLTPKQVLEFLQSKLQ